MTPGPAPRRMRCMSTPRHLQLEILDPEDPVTGTLKDELGQEIPFAGWMSLAVALEQILNPAAPEPRAS